MALSLQCSHVAFVKDACLGISVNDFGSGDYGPFVLFENKHGRNSVFPNTQINTIMFSACLSGCEKQKYRRRTQVRSEPTTSWLLVDRRHTTRPPRLLGLVRIHWLIDWFIGVCLWGQGQNYHQPLSHRSSVLRWHYKILRWSDNYVWLSSRV